MNCSKTIILGMTLAVSLVGCSATYESAEETYQEGNVQEARTAWTELAVEGDSRSMYRLFTSTNRPTEDDIKWLKQAADSGLVEAQYDYGVWLVGKEKYKEGQSYLTLASDNSSTKAQSFLEKNKKLFPLWIKAESGNTFAIKQLGEYHWNKKEYKDSLAWYERCVKDYTYCSFYLGLAYDNGYGVEQDYTKAVEWYKKSASYGNKDSQRNLAWLYEDGKGTSIDKKQAFYWMTKAAESGWTIPTSELGRFYLYGIGTSENNQKAFELLSKVADKNKYAAYHLAKMYYNGWGIPQDYTKSYQWFVSASKKGHAASTWYVGHHYYKGLGKDKSYYEAYKWFTKAAEKGDVDAQFRLGWMLSNGEGVNRNYRKAFEWYTKAADQGSSSAQNNLAYMYENGQGIAKDIYQAYHYYKKAAESGNKTAQHNLGNGYKNGKGVSRSYPLAAYWFAKSAQQNYKDAQVSLNNILYKLKTRQVNVREADVYSEANFDSSTIKSLKKGEKVYVLSEGSQWTEVYYPERNTLGYIHKTHLL